MRYQNDIKMKEKILFTEQQKLWQPATWVLSMLLLCIPFLFLRGVIRQWVHGIPFGHPPLGTATLIAIAAVLFIMVICLILLLFVIQIDTVVSSEGISLKTFPFHRSFRLYRWENISAAYVKRYNPIKEFGVGGNGIRFGARTQVYAVSGMQRLHIEFKNGKRLLIGTKKAKELAWAINKAKEMNINNQFKI